MKKKIIYALIFFPLATLAQNTQVLTFISPRSQGFNTPRIISGWDTVTHCPDKDASYSTYALTLEGTSTFRPERINQCLFGQDIVRRDKCDTEWKDFLIISGSQTENRSPQKDWLADYFGLPTDFRSIVHFRPRVNNIIVEMQSFFAFNAVIKGLYAELFLPIVHTNWDLNMREAVLDPGTNDYVPGYFNAAGVDRDDLLNAFSCYISGKKIPTIPDTTFHPLTTGIMNLKSLSATHCAELRANLGYDHFIQEMHHVGIKMQLAAPLGNRPHARYLFEPIVGNQHHWELGLGATAHALVFENSATDEKVDFFLDVTVNHMFKAHQRRSFDLIGAPNSRYMLAQKMTPTITDNLTGNGIPAVAQFDNEVTAIINLTTYDVDVSINCQADVALMFSYTHRRNYWTVGYNAWKRGCESITIKNMGNLVENMWSIKGDAQLFGFVGEGGTLPLDTPVALSATESAATINYGTNLPKTGISTDPVQAAAQIAAAIKNPNIDSPQPAFAGSDQYLVASTADTTIANQINTSIQPRIISCADIDINSAASSGFSQKMFTHFNHTIITYGRADAFIGFGAEMEFGRQAGPPPVIGDDKCINCALSSWGIWLKGGASW